MVTFCCPLVNEMLKFALTEAKACIRTEWNYREVFFCYRRVLYNFLQTQITRTAFVGYEIERNAEKLNLVPQRWSVYVMQTLYHTGRGAEEGQKRRLSDNSTKCPLLSSHLYVSWTPFEDKCSRSCATRCPCRGQYPRISMLCSHVAFAVI